MMQVISRSKEIKLSPDDVWDREELYNAQMKIWLPGTCEALCANNIKSAADTLDRRFTDSFDSWPRELIYRRQAFLKSIQGHHFERQQLSDFIVLAYHEMYASANKLAKIWKSPK